MTLEEAIKLNNKVLTTFDYRLEEGEKAALKLGIEALQHELILRANGNIPDGFLLPGETRK